MKLTLNDVVGESASLDQGPTTCIAKSLLIRQICSDGQSDRRRVSRGTPNALAAGSKAGSNRVSARVRRRGDRKGRLTTVTTALEMYTQTFPLHGNRMGLRLDSIPVKLHDAIQSPKHLGTSAVRIV